MVPIPRVRRLLVAIVLATGAVASSQAAWNSDQVFQSDYELEERLPGMDRGLFSRTPVAGAPLSAIATITWQRPGSEPLRQAVTKYFRDAVGRVRAEQAYSDVRTDSALRRVFVAPETDSRTVLVLDNVSAAWRHIPRASAAMIVGKPFRLTLPIADRCVALMHLAQSHHAFYHGPNAVMEEAVGRRFAEGVTAEGYRFETTLLSGHFSLSADLVVRSERWVSPDLRLLIYSRTKDAVAGVVEYPLSDINRSEPSADLFTVPDAPPAAAFLEVNHGFVSPYVKPFKHHGPCDRLP